MRLGAKRLGVWYKGQAPWGWVEALGLGIRAKRLGYKGQAPLGIRDKRHNYKRSQNLEIDPVKLILLYIHFKHKGWILTLYPKIDFLNLEIPFTSQKKNKP